ncbi:hypothetical protein OIV83_005421 [Microbotryomycetes sp. JL201]|nr:hypothetical protein OIV83_005421 [Microbotryomycetes sp. JL201]
MSWLNQPYQGGYGGQQQQGQPGGQYGLQPQMTGYQPGLQPQRTGFPGQQQMQQPSYLGGPIRQQQQPLQAQPTGFAPMQQRPMMTGYPGVAGGASPATFQHAQPTGYPSQMPGAFGGAGGNAIQSQFLSTFMPAPNTQPSPYMDPSQMQFANPHQAGQSLQQQFQQQNQAQTGQAAVPVPWALAADEKKRYDQIFRAWDQSGSGFIDGRVAIEVFGQSGLDRNDLMAIWNLADVADRGKLNIDEFHVAMGLIYRRLNGNPIPQTLPPEMAPPSARDLDDSVGFLTNLLKHETRERSTNKTDLDGGRQSMAKARSLHDNSPQQPYRKDATVFRNNDDDVGAYKSSARHINRDEIRSRSDRDTPSSDLDDIKQRLKKTQSALDRSRDQDDEDEDLKQELRDMRRRIERVQDDLEYNIRSGRRTTAKDEERRKLERELLKLEHEELPALERRMEEKDREKRRDKQKYALERDSRNDRYDKYRDEPSRYDSRDDSRERDRGYMRGTYDGERSRDRYASSPPRSRTPPPAPPAPTKSAAAGAPPPPPPSAPPPVAAPAPSASPAANLSSMSPEERAAARRAEAQRRVQERLRALGVAAPSDAPAVDTTVADRLEQEKAEAAKKAAAADEELKAKELERKARLERERLKGIAVEQSINEKSESAVEQVRQEVQASTPDKSVARAADAQLDAEEEALRQREEALKKEKQERLARIEQLEKEAREAEENFQRSKAAFQAKTAKQAPPPPASRAKPAPPPSRTPVKAPTTAAAPNNDDDDFAPPATPSAPSLGPSIASPDPATSPSATTESKNPFHRLQNSASSPSADAQSPAPGSKPNPFFANPAPPVAPPAPAAPPSGSVAPPVRQQAAPAPKAAYVPPPTDDDWDAGGLEKDQDDSDSDDEGGVGSSRQAQANLAANLFRGLGLGPARPPSAQASTPTRSNAASPAPAGPPPPAPPAAPAAPIAPPAPSAPTAPAPPAAPSAPSAPPAPLAAPGDRSALLGAIQAGKKLRKAVTRDASGPSVTGSVIGDPSPPVQAYRAPSPVPSPPRAPSPPQPAASEKHATDGAVHELLQDDAGEPVETLPAIADEDPLDAVDKTITHRMYSLYAYEGQRTEDLTFPENAVLLVHPAKDAASDWLYGTLETTQLSGWIPKAYVEKIHSQPAKALYSYSATSAEEISFDEGETLTIVDTSDTNWFKAERDGIVGLVPATYVELNPSEEEPRAGAKPEDTVTNASLYGLATVSSLDADSDEDSDVESPARNPAERESERLKVLEAAGLLVRDEQSDSNASHRKRRKAPRRPPPPRPQRKSIVHGGIGTPDTNDSIEADELEAVEESLAPEEREERMEDAYDLYQKAMRQQSAATTTANRLSVVSADPDRAGTPANMAPDLSPPPSPGPQPTSLLPSSGLRDALHSTKNSLLSKIGRNATPAPSGGDKPKLIVSGPVSIATPEERPSSTTLGSTWTSLIDPSALANLPDRERKRQEAIFELIATEQAYVSSLQQVVEVFFKALQPVLPAKAAEIIFANIEDILIFNTASFLIFLSDLEERQRASRMYIDSIGDVVDTHVKGLDVYRGYCVNQSNATRTLSDVKAADPSLRAMLDSLRVKNLELEHFLLEPMQRLTRYPLLINQIQRYTEQDHVDHELLAKGLRMAESTLNDVNEAVRARDNEEKLAYLSDHLSLNGVNARLDLTAPTRAMGKRLVLKEGRVTKAKSARPLSLYLFNDLLLMTEESPAVPVPRGEIVYKYPMPLEEVSVHKSSRDDLVFQIHHRGETIKLKSASTRQCAIWVRDIDQARTR